MLPPIQAPPPEPKSGKFGVLVRVGMFFLLGYTSFLLISGLSYGLVGPISAVFGVFAAAAIANAVALRVWERGVLADVGLGWSPASRKNLGLGLVGGIGAALLVMLPPLLVGGAILVPNPDWKGSFTRGAFTCIILVFGAVGEELLYRGYGFQLLISKMGAFATILPVSVLFGLAHSGNLHATWLSVANTALWSLILCMAFLKSRDLWLPIGLHYGWNVTLPLFGVNLSGFTMNITGHGIEWKISRLWSGGDYGPEGGLLTTCVAGMLLYALWKAPVERQFSFLYHPEDEEV